MTDTFSLDLDTLKPKQATVKLGGKEYSVEPPKLKTLVVLSKIATAFDKLGEGEQASDQSVVGAIADLQKALVGTIPELADDGIDLSLEQASALLKFVFEMASPPDTQALKEKGIEPAQKKMMDDSSEQSPTS
ncbi:hypothetical protein [Polynucleobacter sp.]|uniref:hypothetical protein n=1 Tax=Polynucleobacter sp. TaxID=2029855 RepID=UPI003F697CA9